MATWTCVSWYPKGRTANSPGAGPQGDPWLDEDSHCPPGINVSLPVFHQVQPRLPLLPLFSRTTQYLVPRVKNTLGATLKLTQP